MGASPSCQRAQDFSVSHVQPFVAERTRLLRLRLTSRGASMRLSAQLAFRHPSRSPRVRRVTFSPPTRRIYVRSVWRVIGLRVSLPPRPPSVRLVCASCSSGRGFAYGFLPTSPRGDAVAVPLGVPTLRASRGLSPPNHFPGGFRLPVAGIPSETPRVMPGAQRKTAPVSRPGPFSESG